MIRALVESPEYPRFPILGWTILQGAAKSWG